MKRYTGWQNWRKNWKNKFDTQVGGNDWEQARPWSRTDADCYWDKTVGYDDNYSVAISRDSSSKDISTWFNPQFFGFPGESEFQTAEALLVLPATV